MATLHPPMVYEHVLRYTLFFVLQLIVMGTQGIRALSCSGSEDEGIHVQPDPPRASYMYVCVYIYIYIYIYITGSSAAEADRMTIRVLD